MQSIIQFSCYFFCRAQKARFAVCPYYSQTLRCRVLAIVHSQVMPYCQQTQSWPTCIPAALQTALRKEGGI